MFQSSELSQAYHRGKNLNVIGLSLVIPIHNQAEMLLPFLERLTPVLGKLDQNCEVIFIDDGSTDASWDVLSNLPLAECEFLNLKFSRHFGRDAAISAGLKQVRGLAAITFNSDLQDAPELIPYLLQAWMKGYDVVHLSQASPARATLMQGMLHNRLLQCFKKHFKRDLLGTEEIDGKDNFRLLSLQVIDSIKDLPERYRHVEDLYDWLGYSQVSLTSDDIKGSQLTHLPRHLHQAEKLVFQGIKPFRVIAWCGGLISISAVAYGFFALINILFFATSSEAYPSLIVAQILLLGIQLLALGVIGEYIARVLVEVKQRPLYVIEQVEQKASLAQRQSKAREC